MLLGEEGPYERGGERGTLNPQIKGFSEFFVILGCDIHFESELHRNVWR